MPNRILLTLGIVMMALQPTAAATPEDIKRLSELLKPESRRDVLNHWGAMTVDRLWEDPWNQIRIFRTNYAAQFTEEEQGEGADFRRRAGLKPWPTKDAIYVFILYDEDENGITCFHYMIDEEMLGNVSHWGKVCGANDVEVGIKNSGSDPEFFAEHGGPQRLFDKIIAAAIR